MSVLTPQYQIWSKPSPSFRETAHADKWTHTMHSFYTFHAQDSLYHFDLLVCRLSSLQVK